MATCSVSGYLLHYWLHEITDQMKSTNTKAMVPSALSFDCEHIIKMFDAKPCLHGQQTTL